MLGSSRQLQTLGSGAEPLQRWGSQGLMRPQCGNQESFTLPIDKARVHPSRTWHAQPMGRLRFYYTCVQASIQAKKISIKASISAKTRRASRCLQRRNTFRHVYSQGFLEDKSQSKKKNQEKKITINTQTTIRDHYQIRQIKEFSLLILEIYFKNVKDTSSSS